MMANLINDKNGLKRIQFVDIDGRRKTIRLGKQTKKDAEDFKGHLESLLSLKAMGGVLTARLAMWADELSNDLHAKLAQFDLVKSREIPETDTVLQFVDAFIASREADTKASTRTVFKRTRKHFADFFGPKKRIAEVNTGDAPDFRRHLIRSGMADNTIRRTCGIARQFFADAIERELLAKNPFATRSISVAVRGNAARFQFVSREDAQKVIDACPSAQTRLVFALARFGGLRIPSETLKLRWSDIDFETKRMTVHAPKTEHHEGKATRTVPIFPELEPYLRDAFDPEQVYVVTIAREAGKNFRTRFAKIIEKAGVEPWPKLFQNLRATRQTELAGEHPAHVVCDWMGNSQAVASKHYLHTSHKSGAQSGAVCIRIGGKWGESVGSRLRRNQGKSRIRREHEETEWAMRDSNRMTQQRCRITT